MKKLARVLELVIGLLLVAAVASQITYRRGDEASAEPVRGVLPGDVLEVPASIDLGRRERTLLLSLSPHCPFCIDSMGFYRRLSRLPPEVRDRLQMIGAVRDPEEVELETRALAQQGVELDALILWDFKKAGIAGTPILTLIRPDGRVEAVWRGMLMPEEEAEALEAIRASVAPGGAG